MRLDIGFGWLEPREEGVFIAAAILYDFVRLFVDLVFGFFLVVNNWIRSLLTSCFWLNAFDLRLSSLYLSSLIIVKFLHRL